MFSALKNIIHLFIPHSCELCLAPLLPHFSSLCEPCLGKLKQIAYPLTVHPLLIHKLMPEVPIQKAIVYYPFVAGGVIQYLIHLLKYKNQPKLGRVLGEEYGKALSNTTLLQDIDIIVPIPLHPFKYIKRGYNQAEEIAKGLSVATMLPMSGRLLMRVRNTESQTKKNLVIRKKNLMHVFQVADKALIRDKHVLLVDDVATTGATLSIAAQILLEKGAKAVSVAPLAFTV